MDGVIRVVAVLPGVMMLVNGIRLAVEPGAMLEGLGMPLLNGAALSTQMGDIGALFLGTGILAIYGGVRRSPGGLYAAALLLALVACYRLLAYAVYGADLATVFIGIELASAGWLIGAGLVFNKRFVQNS